MTPGQLIRPEILALKNYVVEESQGLIKLDAMENPYGLPTDLQEEIARLVARTPLNRYPDPAASKLKARLRKVMGVPKESELLLGNGSDELIQIIAMAVAKPGAAMLTPEPSFVMYKIVAPIAGIKYIGIDLNSDFTLNMETLLAAIRKHQPAVIFIAYPNNPSGNLFPVEQLEQILHTAQGLVVIDEAYHVYAQESFMSRLPEFPNLIVMRTVSKMGLAGLRLGLIAGSSAWLTEFNKLRLPYNINVLTQGVADIVLDHQAVLMEQAQAIKRDLANMQKEMNRMQGVHTFPTDANFVLFRVPDANRVFEGLQSRGVLIRNMHGGHPLLENCLRTAVGTPTQNRRLLDALRESLS